VLRDIDYLLFRRNKYNQTAKMIQSKINRIRTIQVDEGLPGNNPEGGVELGVTVGSMDGDGVLDGV